MREKTKIIEINGTRFQLARFLPNVGSFILMKMLGAVIQTDGAAPQTETASAPTVGTDDLVRTLAFASFLRGLDFDSYCFIQKECLKKCSRMEGNEVNSEVPMPIVMDDGRFVIPEISDDTSLVMRLCFETLVFNLSDFFGQGGLNSLLPQPSSLRTRG